MSEKSLSEKFREEGSDFEYDINDAYKEIMRYYSTSNPEGMQDLFAAFIGWRKRNSTEDKETICFKAYSHFDEICAAIDIYNSAKRTLERYDRKEMKRQERILTINATTSAALVHEYHHGNVSSFYRNALYYYPANPEMNIEMEKEERCLFKPLKKGELQFVMPTDTVPNKKQ